MIIDKITLNNEIVAMRKLVRQAKVHVINKLVREARKLRQRHGPEIIKAKFMRKADRRGEVILAVKKLKADDVSKFALKNSENPIEKLADPNTTIEERAMFRLISKKIIAKKVDEFRSQHSDLDFISETINELGVNRSKTAKTIKLKNESEFSKGKASTLRRVCGKVHHSKPVGSQGVVLMKESDKLSGEDLGSKLNVKVNEVKSKFLSGWTVKNVPLKTEGRKNLLKELETTNNSKMLKGKKLHVNNKDSSNKTCGLSNIGGKSVGVAEIRKFCQHVDESNHVPDKTKMRECSEGIGRGVPDSGNKVSYLGREDVDPFFLRCDGKTEYCTSIVVQEDDDKEDGESWSREKKLFGMECNQRKKEQTSARGGSHIGRGIWAERNVVRRKAARFGAQGNENTFKRRPVVQVADGINLHPSWEAKRKQKAQSISNIVFQGKKTKFDDDGD